MITVLGGKGYIGSKIVDIAVQESVDVLVPSREEISDLTGRCLGDIIYCIGLTSDFRSRLRETFDAHFSVLKDIVARNSYASITYLSTTKVYDGSGDTRVDARLCVQPLIPEHVYAVSKIAGESFALNTCINPRIVRISNVYSVETPDYMSGSFLDSVLRAGVDVGRVCFRTSPESEKDYMSLPDVAMTILKIARGKTNGIFNVARGYNTSNKEIADFLIREGVQVSFDRNAPDVRYPAIEIDPAVCCPNDTLKEDLPKLFARYRAMREADQE